ncbi:dTDP-4-dehydrorhamnose reductase [Ancylobacter sp. TS-1]|uniref:dTDP-4-dehydrorhamnose reductase n=1 Tax=Ancylobacter sp. TS-1 TaxID=1850374 RepID=UPI001265D69D|nr:dTDP-4-dehydrorhamnose reductase [Ancylobacter sp. TS-1]QFR34380.1 dTDP-4-dehydrorhamnose reductase [Ancylobacter sp. TS-1]
MTRLLLLGAGGQVGREIAALAPGRVPGLVALDRAGLDITDAPALDAALAAHRPDVVINAAGYTAVDRAESEPEAAHLINAVAPGRIAAACARHGARLIHISTDYVFDGTKAGAYVEDDPVAPLGVYGISKEAGERAVRERLDAHLIVRTSWVYGIHGANFLKTMLRLARERDRLTVVADQKGCPTATVDVAEGLLAAAVALHEGRMAPGTYHLAGTGATSWYGFARAIIERAAAHTGRRPEIVPIATADYPTPARRPANSELSSEKLAQAIGFRAAPWEPRAAGVVDQILATSAT